MQGFNLIKQGKEFVRMKISFPRYSKRVNQVLRRSQSLLLKWGKEFLIYSSNLIK